MFKKWNTTQILDGLVKDWQEKKYKAGNQPFVMQPKLVRLSGHSFVRPRGKKPTSRTARTKDFVLPIARAVVIIHDSHQRPRTCMLMPKWVSPASRLRTPVAPPPLVGRIPRIGGTPKSPTHDNRKKLRRIGGGGVFFFCVQLCFC